MARPHESRGAHNQIDCSTRLSDLLFFPIDRPFRRSDQRRYTAAQACTLSNEEEIAPTPSPAPLDRIVILASANLLRAVARMRQTIIRPILQAGNAAGSGIAALPATGAARASAVSRPIDRSRTVR